MNITGIGIDMESIGRFRRKDYERNKSFYRSIFSADEIRHCLGKADPYASFAGIFCAKEAVAKALRHDNAFSIPTIEITHAETGAPHVRVAGKESSCLVSISHAGTHAIAFSMAYE